jgi:hypothetical protein
MPNLEPSTTWGCWLAGDPTLTTTGSLADYDVTLGEPQLCGAGDALPEEQLFSNGSQDHI